MSYKYFACLMWAFGLFYGLTGMVGAFQGVQPSNPSVDQKFAAYVDGAGMGKSIDQQMQQYADLLNNNPSTSTRRLIYKKIGECGLSGNGEVFPERLKKAAAYSALALKYPASIQERLETYNNLADAKMRLAEAQITPQARSTSQDWIKNRREIAQSLWQALQEAKDADLAASASSVPTMTQDPHLIRALVPPGEDEENSPEYRQKRAAELAERKQFFDASNKNMGLNRAIQIQAGLEIRLSELYLTLPISFDEMAATGHAIVQDKAYVDSIVSKAKANYALRSQRRVAPRATVTPPIVVH